jgi:hypothetical protein
MQEQVESETTSEPPEQPFVRAALKLPGVSIPAESRAASNTAMAVVSYGAMCICLHKGHHGCKCL